MTPSAQRHAARGEPPTFSFLTTAYRSEDTLARTIEAVRAQTRPDWELVVVDNGMSEAIAEVVRPYLADRRIRFLRQENKGPNGGVMAAADVATGRFVTVLNSDDAVTPEFCERLGAVVESDPAIAAATCDAHLFTDPGTVVRRQSYLQHARARRRPDPTRPIRLAEVIDGPCPYYTAVIRREVWDALGGQACDTPIVDDLDFWLRALAAGYDVRAVPERLALFRMEAGSESRPVDEDRIEEFEEQRERALVSAALSTGAEEDLAALCRVLRRQHHLRAIRRARTAFLRGDITSARGFAQEAFRLRRSVRSALIVATLAGSPALLARLHPVKQRLESGIRSIRHVLTQGRRATDAPARTS